MKWREQKMSEKLKKREEVKREDTWAIEDLFATDEAWEKEFQELEELCDTLGSYKGTLFENAERMADFFKVYENASLILERVYVYAGQKYHEDTTNSKYQGFSERADALMAKYQESIAFLEPEILSADEKLYKEVTEGFFKQIPEKEEGYRRFFYEIIRSKEHSLSVEMEELLASGQEALEAASNIFSMFNNADVKYPSIKL